MYDTLQLYKRAELTYEQLMKMICFHIIDGMAESVTDDEYNVIAEACFQTLSAPMNEYDYELVCESVINAYLDGKVSLDELQQMSARDVILKFTKPEYFS